MGSNSWWLLTARCQSNKPFFYISIDDDIITHVEIAPGANALAFTRNLLMFVISRSVCLWQAISLD
jgi:hypothetical protein